MKNRERAKDSQPELSAVSKLSLFESASLNYSNYRITTESLKEVSENKKWKACQIEKLHNRLIERSIRLCYRSHIVKIRAISPELVRTFEC